MKKKTNREMMKKILSVSQLNIMNLMIQGYSSSIRSNKFCIQFRGFGICIGMFTPYQVGEEEIYMC